MIDRVQQFVGNRLKTVLADAAYCSILDLKDCADRGIELLAPVQANGLTEEKKQSKEPKQIPREEFTYDPQKDLYTCPAGQELPYAGRDRRQRHGDRTILEFRYACDPIHCGSCQLASKCLNGNSSRRMIKRLDGQHLLDAQREKMSDPEVKARYTKRASTIELGFADAKEHRDLTRFHGRGIQRTRTETGLVVLTQNLLRLDRLQRDSVTPGKTTT